MSKPKGDVDVTGRVPVLGGAALLAMCGTVLIGAAYSRRLQNRQPGGGSGGYTRVGAGSVETEPTDRRPVKSDDTGSGFASVAAIGKERPAKNDKREKIGRVVHF